MKQEIIDYLQSQYDLCLGFAGNMLYEILGMSNEQLTIIHGIMECKHLENSIKPGLLQFMKRRINITTWLTANRNIYDFYKLVDASLIISQSRYKTLEAKFYMANFPDYIPRKEQIDEYIELLQWNRVITYVKIEEQNVLKTVINTTPIIPPLADIIISFIVN